MVTGRLPRLVLIVGVVLAGVLVLAPASGMPATDPAPDRPGAGAEGLLVWRVRASGEQVAALLRAGFDVAHSDRDGAMVIGDRSTARRLSALGYRPTAFDTVHRPVPAGAPSDGDTFYGGYRTAAAHEVHLDGVAAAHPDLATIVGIGDSWSRVTSGGGHTISAICLTKKEEGDCALRPDSAKPRFVLMAQIHAREISTAELAWRWIDYLADGYGNDREATAILETTEVWVVPVANPDGVDIVASGGDRPKLQRKNADTSHGYCMDTSIGVDLNRNSSFHWGGDSADPCAETYQGSSAASEPETEAHERFFSAIYPRQRPADDTTPVPDTARGVMITLHSFGNDIIVPWGWTSTPSPNDQQLTALGKKMAESNHYTVDNNLGTVGYLTTGTTDDYTYGVLGVASFTFEVGEDSGECGGFLPQYSCVDATFWPRNKGAFITAAKAAAAPYRLPATG